MLRGSKVIFVFAAGLASLLFAGQAFAHAVYIFAWADNGSICTESYFSKTNKVRGGEVRGLDNEGNLLFSGRTGEDGKICFPMPEKAEDIEFVVLAGEGHRGTFSLGASDIAPFLGGEKEREAASPSASGAEGGANPGPAGDAGANVELRESPALEDMLRRAVREEVQAQLSPLRQQLAEREYDRSPGWKEVFSGLGWILGFAALAYAVLAAKGRNQKG